MNERRSPMYVLNDFNEALRSFASAHASLDIDLKLMTSKRHLYGDVRFYSARDVRIFIDQLMKNFTIVDRCLWSPQYVSIWLKKESWMSSVVKEILTFGYKYGSTEQLKGTVLSLNSDDNDDSVTCLRITLLKDTIRNLAEINGCVVGSNGLNLMVSKRNNPTNSNLILCGSVICKTTANEYKQRKLNVISEMSANRIETDEYPVDIISKLCDVSIVYELLSVRHNKVVNINCNTSNKDSGIFIMYNYSRLYQVWTAYEKSLENGYKSLPLVDDINFGLLTSEEEWNLILNYLSAYPLVIQDSVKYLLSASVDVHKLCKFLVEMSSAVSLFYHRHHILSDPIPSLLPLMYARLYLVKTSIQVYENVFLLLGIKAVREM